MIRPEFRRELQNQQKVLILVWTGLLVATAFYLWLPRLLLDQSQSLGDYPFARTIRQTLWLIVVIEVGFLFWWKKRFLSKQAIVRRAGESRWIPMVVRGHQTPAEERAARAISWYIGGRVTGFAIAESLAVYGVFLAIIGGYFWDQYVLTTLCLLFLIYFYPSKSFITELLKEVT